jgi:3D (Asp-Asp-Asp) domain-containing protein
LFLERFGGLRRLVALTIVFAAVAPASRAMAATPSDGSPRTHTVSFATKGTIVNVTTDAPTVGDFLREEGIRLGDHDSIRPAIDAPITEGTIVEYRSAVPVSIRVGHNTTQVWSAAANVADMLSENGVRLGRFDMVTPARSAQVPANGIVHVTHVATWTTTVVTHIAAPTHHRLDASLAPEISRVRVQGSSGTRVSIVRSLQVGTHVRHVVLSSHVTRVAITRIIADGPQAYEAYQRLREIGALEANNFATRALQMVSMEMIATAYTANCAGCSGMTAIGRRAGHGIVAVDPRFIPIGTKLYISGYGWAIAGDTGGSIRGSRIDLGFDSDAEAMAFGRREVTVYRLK